MQSAQYKVDYLYSAKHFPKAAFLLRLIFTLLVTFLIKLHLKVRTTELL